MFKVFVISLSGVMAPGPMTAAVVVMGSRNRYAGALISVGHAVVEFPLIVLIMLGMDRILKSTGTQIVIGLAGGVFLIIMAGQMLMSLKGVQAGRVKHHKAGPVVTGILLSVGNPYFLLWWATIGLALATDARELGVWAFGLFAIVHWLCDLVWFSVLSWASFKGSELSGGRSQKIVLLVCSAALIVFGVIFIYRAITTWAL